jgi:ribulose kinase
MEGHRVHRILVDSGSSMNILSTKAITNMGIDASRMTLVSTPLIGIEGSAVPVKGATRLIVIMGTAPCCVTLQKTFIIIDTHPPYNAIIGRPLLHQLSAIINIKYLTLNSQLIKE